MDTTGFTEQELVAFMSALHAFSRTSQKADATPKISFRDRDARAGEPPSLSSEPALQVLAFHHHAQHILQ